MKKDFFKNYAVVNLETGEVVSTEDGSKILKSVGKDNQKRAYQKIQRSERNSDKIHIKNKGVYDRRWVMYYHKDIDRMKFSLTAEGMLSKLIHCLREDGSGTLYGETSKKYWYNKLEVKNTTFSKYFKELEDKGLVTYQRGLGILINPYYIRYGNYINKELIESFSHIIEVKGDGLSLKVPHRV